MNPYSEVWHRCRNVATTKGHPRRHLATTLQEWGMPDHPRVIKLMPVKSRWRRAAIRSMKARKAAMKKVNWADQRRECIEKFNKALGYHGIVEWEF